MYEDIATFLEKIKEYNLSNQLFESESFKWISILDKNDLKKINSLDKKEFKDALFKYIYDNDFNYKIKKYDFLKKLKDNNNPYLDIIESIIDCYEIKLNDYFLKLDNKSSRKMTIFDLLDLFANAKSREHAKNADYSLYYLLEKNCDNLYEIEKIITSCENEKSSDIIKNVIIQSHYDSETSLVLDYYINLLSNIKDDVCLKRFDSFLYRFKLNGEENYENYFNIMDGISKFDQDELYKYFYIEKILDYSPLPFSYKNIDRIIKCDDKKVVLLIYYSYNLCFLYMGSRKSEKYDIEKLTNIIYDVYLNSNTNMIDFLYRYMSPIFGILDKNDINPVDYMENITKIDDYNTIQRIEKIVKNGNYSYANCKKKMKKLTKTLNVLSINEVKNEC